MHFATSTTAVFAGTCLRQQVLSSSLLHNCPTSAQPHEDGPAYHPGVCIVSMGGPAVIRFRPKPSASAERATQQQHAGGEQAPEQAAAPHASPKMVSLLLLPRSLLIFKDEAYTSWLHGIDEVS